MSEGTLTVTPEHVLQRKAHISLPPAARIALLEKLGMPFNVNDPDAQLSEFQRDILSRQERYVYVEGASGTGKSALGGGLAMLDFLLPFTHTVMGSLEYQHVGRDYAYFDLALKAAFGDVPAAFVDYKYKNVPGNYSFHAKSVWGAEVTGMSLEADEGKAALGTQATRFIACEGAFLPHDTYERRITRLLDRSLMTRADGLPSYPTGRLNCLSTPRSDGLGFDSVETEKIRKESLKRSKGECENVFTYDKTPFVESVYIRSIDALENPAFSREAYAARKKSLGAAAFAEQYQGKRVHSRGLVYPSFGGRLTVPHPAAEEIRKMTLGVGIDTGTFSAAVLYGKLDDHGVCLGEVYLPQATVETFCNDIEEMVETVLGPVYGHTKFAELRDLIDYWYVDPASQIKLDLMDNLDIVLAHPMHDSGGKFFFQPTRDEIEAQMAAGQLKFSEDLVFLPDQLGKYRWAKKKATRNDSGEAIVREPASGQADHCPDAMRFVVVSMMNEGSKAGEPLRLSADQERKRVERDWVFGPLEAMLEHAREHGEVDC